MDEEQTYAAAEREMDHYRQEIRELMDHYRQEIRELQASEINALRARVSELETALDRLGDVPPMRIEVRGDGARLVCGFCGCAPCDTTDCPWAKAWAVRGKS